MEIMENIEWIETGLLAGMIMVIIQVIVAFIPTVDKRLITLIVSVVLSVVAIVSIEAIEYIEVILAVLGQVFAYDFILQPTRKAITGK